MNCLRPEAQVTEIAAQVLIAAMAAICLAAGLVLGVGLAERFDPVGLAALIAWLLAMALVVMRPGWPAVLAVTVLSVMLRWVSAKLTAGVELGADPMNYANLANAVLNGQGLVTDDWQYGRDLKAYFPPLYPLVLAGFWYLFGNSIVATLSMNTLIDLLAAWCIADAGRRLVSREAGLAAALAYIAWPAFALAAAIPQKESITMLLVLLMLRGMVVWREQTAQAARQWCHGLMIGFWWGMLALTQPSLSLAPGLVALWLMREKGIGPVVRLGLTALPAILVVLLPWWLRNWLVLGSFVPLTTASGMMANSALGSLRVPFPEGLFLRPEDERSAIMGHLARQKALAYPLEATFQSLRSLAIGFAYEEASIARFRHTSPPISLQDHARLAPLLQGAWTILLFSALRRVWQGLRRGLIEPVTLYTIALLVAIVGVNFWFEFGERHRLVLTPLLLLLACGFWTQRSVAAGRRD